MLSEIRLKEIATILRQYENIVDSMDDCSNAEAKFVAECKVVLPELLYTLKYIQDEHHIICDALKTISMENSYEGVLAESILKRLNLL